jgi:hypothetical protein
MIDGPSGSSAHGSPYPRKTHQPEGTPAITKRRGTRWMCPYRNTYPSIDSISVVRRVSSSAPRRTVIVYALIALPSHARARHDRQSRHRHASMGSTPYLGRGRSKRCVGDESSPLRVSSSSSRPAVVMVPVAVAVIRCQGQPGYHRRPLCSHGHVARSCSLGSSDPSTRATDSTASTPMGRSPA